MAFGGLLLVVVAILAATIGAGWHLLELTTVVTVAIGTGARHLAYLIGPLFTRLRRSLLDPLPTFAVVGLSDASTLVLLVASLSESQLTLRVSPNSIAKAALDLVTLNNIGGLWRQPITAWPVAALAILFFTVIIKSLVQLNQLRRTDDDFLTMASNLAKVGDYPAARKWAVRGQSGGPRSHEVRTQIDLATLKFDSALERGKHWCRALGESDSLDAVLTTIWGLTLLLPWDPEQRSSYLAKELEWGAADSTVVAHIDQCRGYGLIDMHGLASTLSGRSNELTHPLTVAELRIGINDIDGAIAVLQQARPGVELDEVQRLLLLFQLETSRQETGTDRSAFFEEWNKNTFPEVRDLAIQLAQPGRHSVLTMLVGAWVSIAYAVAETEAVWALSTNLIDLCYELEETEGELDLYLDAHDKIVRAGQPPGCRPISAPRLKGRAGP
jgi:hypothetical protein